MVLAMFPLEFHHPVCGIITVKIPGDKTSANKKASENDAVNDKLQ